MAGTLSGLPPRACAAIVIRAWSSARKAEPGAGSAGQQDPVWLG